MLYTVERNENYDFIEESYASLYPNLHQYPATMLPQIGIEILKEYNITKGALLDPYCGSGSSFSSGLEFQFDKMYGFDLNPLAILISSAKFTRFNPDILSRNLVFLQNSIYESAKINYNNIPYVIPDCKNIDFWFSQEIQIRLAVIQYFVNQLKQDALLFKVALSETIRDCSYTRNGEFKLYRMKEDSILRFNPDVFSIFLKKCQRNIEYYLNAYLPKLQNTKFYINNYALREEEIPKVDVVLTSPPYGDSKTTVAYGQFSNFSNEWLSNTNARSVDSQLMGGLKSKQLYTKGIMKDYINKINEQCIKRSFEISSFYFDLEDSIKTVAKTIKMNGYSIYVVGNRTVKKIQLPTDQFIAEIFENNGFKHIKTYKRLISSKVMPLRNSPTNKIGDTVSTMNYEYIVVSRKMDE